MVEKRHHKLPVCEQTLGLITPLPFITVVEATPGVSRVFASLSSLPPPLCSPHLPHPSPHPLHPLLPWGRELMHSTSPQGPEGLTHMYVCVRLSDSGAALCVRYHAQLNGLLRQHSLPLLLYITSSSPPVNTRLNMHTIKQTNKQILYFLWFGSKEADFSVNNNSN